MTTSPGWIAAILLALATTLAGCTRSLDDESVREFVEVADDAARMRFALRQSTPVSRCEGRGASGYRFQPE